MDTPSAYVIDVRSDTITKPTNSMREAMRTADVGDDVFGEDPTVNKLEERVAQILGKEAALFVPSGTMANLISVLVHCNKRGCEAIVGDKSHIFKYEQGGVAQLGGVMLSTLKNNDDGTFDLTELERRVRGSDIHETKTTLVAVENTHNVCGGKVLPISWLKELAVVAKRNSLSLHMDGARLFNAATYLAKEPADIVRDFDSVSICFSKGLGAPVGSAIAASSEFIKEARRLRKALGGGMRQVGVIAAPALISLDEIVPALNGDHRRAKFLGESINAMKSSIFSVDVKNLHTNIVMINISEDCNVSAKSVEQRLEQVLLNELNQGCRTEDGEGIIIKTIGLGHKLLRIVTHFQISDVDINLTIKKLTFVCKEFEATQSKGFWR